MNYLVVTLRTGESLLPELYSNAWWVRVFRVGGITVSYKLVGIARPLDQALLNNPFLLARGARGPGVARRLGVALHLFVARDSGPV